MKKIIGILAILLILPSAFALDRYVTLKITSFKDKSNTDIWFVPVGNRMTNGWVYCVDAECTTIIGTLAQNWNMTIGPFNGFVLGSTHYASIKILGDYNRNTADLQMRSTLNVPRAWRSSRINASHCQLNSGNNDNIAAGLISYFAAENSADGNVNSGYGDVDDCSAGGQLAWYFGFTVV